jgi:hypothetical protein
MLGRVTQLALAGRRGAGATAGVADVLLFGEPESESTVRSAGLLVEGSGGSQPRAVISCTSISSAVMLRPGHRKSRGPGRPAAQPGMLWPSGRRRWGGRRGAGAHGCQPRRLPADHRERDNPVPGATSTTHSAPRVSTGLGCRKARSNVERNPPPCVLDRNGPGRTIDSIARDRSRINQSGP